MFLCMKNCIILFGNALLDIYVPLWDYKSVIC